MKKVFRHNTMIGIQECPICFNEPPAESRFVLTPCCRQLFCSTCCTHVLQMKLSCPFCNQPLVKATTTRTTCAPECCWIPVVAMLLIGILMFVVLSGLERMGR